MDVLSTGLKDDARSLDCKQGVGSVKQGKGFAGNRSVDQVHRIGVPSRKELIQRAKCNGLCERNR